MRKFLKQLALASSAIMLVSACSTTDEIPVKELQEFNAKIKPDVVWKASVGDGVENYFSHLNPVVVGDYIIAADRVGVVAAYQRSNGKRVWRKELREELNFGTGGWWSQGEPMRIAGGLTAERGVVYLGSENGDVVALDVADGNVKWHSQVGIEILADPAVGSGVVVVKGSSGDVVALNLETGAEQWRYGTESPALTLRGTAAPIIAQGGVFIGTATGKVVVVIAENGQPAWETRLAVPSGSTELQRIVDVDSKPVLFGGVLYNVAYNGSLVAVDVRNGNTIWKREYSSFQNLTLAEGRLFLTDASDTVSALNLDGGIELWSNTDYNGRLLTAPVQFGDYIVVGDSMGYLHFLDILNGRTVGRLDVGEEVYTAPVVEGDTLYLQARDGSLLAVRI
ncbi:outer membrane protein assembly factor BamB [Pseudidiomarina woesei]|uniref:Outer membrane protein assembly factor BamB n=1 Tax=Pseudidiomarina woesei TaxID=1381080 RepID=A0A0K6H6D0_9GAMM|nr:outer membrane protein assembly factor BamB [Pseudidiomarina woesei]CUA86545.1 outer membrane assembly lipoprotein YfgL [Pseudidiomarina woesei]